MSGPAPRPAMRPEAQLALIRIAMLVGVLVFGGVTWFLHRQPGYAPAWGREQAQSFGRVVSIAMIAAVAAIVALRVAASRADPVRARSLTVVGWAAGEFAAFAGGVYYFLTNDPQWFGTGLLVLLASYVVLPIRRE